MKAIVGSLGTEGTFNVTAKMIGHCDNFNELKFILKYTKARIKELKRQYPRCSGCGKRWCGTDLKVKSIYPNEPEMWGVNTYGSKKCRNKAAKQNGVPKYLATK